jgi:hypothetical protein
MNKLVFLLFPALILLACNRNKSKDVLTVKDTLQMLPPKADSVSTKTDTHYYWEAMPDDNSNRLIMKRTQPISNDSLTAANLISRLNSKYDHIRLQLVKISGDTIFVKIGQSNFLTQQMGSTGADMYLTEATYNLSELNNIGYVNFDFKEGDHAAPGTYSRSDFVNIKFSTK